VPNEKRRKSKKTISDVCGLCQQSIKNKKLIEEMGKLIGPYEVK